MSKKETIELDEKTRKMLDFARSKGMTDQDLKEAIEGLAEEKRENIMVNVSVSLYKPFYDFLEEYRVFFGSKMTIEAICRDMIYKDIDDLYRKLEEFVDSEASHLESEAWPNKHTHLSITSSQEEMEE